MLANNKLHVSRRPLLFATPGVFFNSSLGKKLAAKTPGQQSPETCALSLIMMRVLLTTFGVAFVAAQCANGSTRPVQSLSNPLPRQPSFEVATIKPNKSGDPMIWVWFGDRNRVSETNVTIKSLIEFAYDLTDQELSGGPAWLTSERFDVNAKIEDPMAASLDQLSGVERIDQLRKMFQSLLASRLNLQVTRQTKELRVLALVREDHGPKLSSASGKFGASDTGEGLTMYGCTLESLKDDLAQRLNLRILDETGLTGVYDIALDWSTQDSTSVSDGNSGDPDAGFQSDSLESRISRALSDQLGLKLKPRKGVVPTTVVEHVDKPSEN